jgi:hypothetical protein
MDLLPTSHLWSAVRSELCDGLFMNGNREDGRRTTTPPMSKRMAVGGFDGLDMTMKV